MISSIVVSICISLMINDIEQLFMCSLVIYTSFFGVLCSFQVLCSFFNWIVCLFVVSPMNFGSFSNQWGQEKKTTDMKMCVCVCLCVFKFLVQLEYAGNKTNFFILSVICLPFQS